MVDIGSTEISTPELSNINTPKQVGESGVEKTDKRTERKQEEEEFNNRKNEAVGKIKSGEDVQGKKLYDAYISSLSDPQTGDTSFLYTEAGKSVLNIEEPGEANKAVVAMDALYKKLGSEGYRINPKDIPDNLSPVERKQFLKDKITQDYHDGLAKKLADKFIDSYAGSLVELQDAKAELKSKTSIEDVSRTEVRKASYKVEDKVMKLLHMIERGTAQIGNTDIGEELKDEIEAREEVTEYVKSEEFGDLNPEDQARLIDTSVNNFRDKLEDDDKQQKAGWLDRMSEERKNATFKPIAEKDHEIINLRQNLEKNLNAEPWDICQMVSEIKELQLEKKALITKANITLLEQRLDEAKNGWEEGWDKTLNSFIRGKDKGKALGNLVSAGKEWVSSQGALLGEKLRKGVSDSIDRINSGLEEEKDNSVEALRNIDESFFLEARTQTNSIKERVTDIVVGTKDRVLRMNSETRNNIFNTERTLYEWVHEADISWQMSKMDIYEKGRRFGMETSIKAAGIIGEVTGRDLNEKVDSRLAAIERFSDREIRNKIETIKEENKDNPLFKHLEDDLERRLRPIEKMKNVKDKMAEPSREDVFQKPVITSPGEAMTTKVEGSISDKNVHVESQQTLTQDLTIDKQTGIKTREEYEDEQAKQIFDIKGKFYSVLNQALTIEQVFPALLTDNNNEKHRKFVDYKSSSNLLFDAIEDEQDLDRRRNMLMLLDKNVQNMQSVLDNLF